MFSCHHVKYTFLILAGHLVLLALFLAGCSDNLFERRSPVDRWALAVVQRDYSAAEQFMTTNNLASWKTETEHLNRQHQGLQSYQMSDISTAPSENPVTQTKWTWNDGFVRCLYIRITEDGKIDLADSSYHDCSEDIATPPSIKH
jgi:hypothetical protein